jgi:hypothetical protein
MLASARWRIGDGRDPSGLARARRDLRSAAFTKRFLHRPGRGCNARTHAVAVDEGRSYARRRGPGRRRPALGRPSSPPQRLPTASPIFAVNSGHQRSSTVTLPTQGTAATSSFVLLRAKIPGRPRQDSNLRARLRGPSLRLIGPIRDTLSPMRSVTCWPLASRKSA